MRSNDKIFRKWIKRAMLASTCFLVIDLACFAFLPVRLIYFPEFEGPSRPVDMAAVLFNGINQSHTGVNRETERRLNTGMSLLRSKKVDFLLVAGGYRPSWNFQGAELMAKYLVDLGVPAEKILVEGRSMDTITNLENINRIRKEKNIETAGLVSSPFHLLRIQAMKAPFADSFIFLPYDVLSCSPRLTRVEIWFSAHYNLAACIASKILPGKWYRAGVLWVRKHTGL